MRNENIVFEWQGKNACSQVYSVTMCSLGYMKFLGPAHACRPSAGHWKPSSKLMCRRGAQKLAMKVATSIHQYKAFI